MIDAIITGMRYGLVGLGCLMTVLVGSAVLTLLVNVVGTMILNVFKKDNEK